MSRKLNNKRKLREFTTYFFQSTFYVLIPLSRFISHYEVSDLLGYVAGGLNLRGQFDVRIGLNGIFSNSIYESPSIYDVILN